MLAASAQPHDQVRQLLEARKARYATLAFVDHHGQLRRKSVAVEKVRSALTGGIAFSPYTFLLDLGDRPLYPEHLGRDIQFEDNVCRVIHDAPRILPFEEPGCDLFFFVEFEPGNLGHGWDPRVIYRRAESRLAALGLTPLQSLEYEFRLFRESPDSARGKRFRDLTLLNATSCYGGAMMESPQATFFHELREACRILEIPVESLHWEVAPSLAEAALRYREGIAAADDAVLFKAHAKLLAQRHGMMLSFMALPLQNADGQSGHVHLSLRGNDGAPAFFDSRASDGISRTMRHFIGGLSTLMPELLLMLAPNVNSFKRLAPGHFAPVAANWGFDNRTTAIRVIAGSPQSQRLECRVAGSDANPYLVLAAIAGAGAWGIENRVEPPEPSRGSTYRNDAGIDAAQRFPSSFEQAVERFGNSAVARELFGEDFVAVFAGTRAAQAREMARLISDVELERFFELA